MKASEKNLRARNYQRNNSIKFSRIEKCISRSKEFIYYKKFLIDCYVPEHIEAYKGVCKVFSNVSDNF